MSRAGVLGTVLLLAGSAALLLARGCPHAGFPDPLARPGAPVLLITVEGLRADFSRFTALPNLSAFERETFAFRSALTPAPLSLPAHASLMTGDYPARHGMRGTVSAPLPPEVVTLAEILHSRGYATAAVVSSPFLDRRFRLDQGFDDYFDARGPGGGEPPCAAGALGAATRAALLRLEAEPAGPWFLWVQYRVPPLEGRIPDREAEADSPAGRGAYAPGLLLLDAEIGRLFDFLRERHRWEGAFVALAAVHGEALGEGGEVGHGLLLSAATVRIPLLLKLTADSGVPPGDVGAAASLVDLRPTLLDLLGIPDDRVTDGRSLLGLLHGRPAGEEWPVLVESSYPRDQFGGPFLRGVRIGPYFYQEGWSADLQIHQDPREGPADPLVWDPERERRMRGDLERETAAREGAAPARAAADYLDPALGRALRECGYPEERAPGPGSAIDVHRVAELEARVNQARGFLGRQAPERAEEALRSAAALDPENPGLLHFLALLRRRRGEPGDAAMLLAAALEREPNRPSLFADLGLLHLEQGAPDQAVAVLEAGVARFPDSIPLRNALGEAWIGAGQGDRAAAEFRKTLGLAPEDAPALRALAGLAVRQGDLRAAAEHLRRILKRDPDSVAVRLDLGEVLLDLGEAERRDRGEPAGEELILDAIGQFRSVLLRAPGEPRATAGIARAREGS